jgi:hypothetical protein
MPRRSTTLRIGNLIAILHFVMIWRAIASIYDAGLALCGEFSGSLCGDIFGCLELFALSPGFSMLEFLSHFPPVFCPRSLLSRPGYSRDCEMSGIYGARYLMQKRNYMRYCINWL